MESTKLLMKLFPSLADSPAEVQEQRPYVVAAEITRIDFIYEILDIIGNARVAVQKSSKRYDTWHRGISLGIRVWSGEIDGAKQERTTQWKERAAGQRARFQGCQVVFKCSNYLCSDFKWAVREGGHTGREQHTDLIYCIENNKRNK